MTSAYRTGGRAPARARVWADLSAQGNVPGAHDLLVAAAALVRGWAVVTSDPVDFRRVPGLRVTTPR